ncbi:hypothetical protein Cni_G24419 [Canna indica]|uniref:Seed maturation protein n=1 Tax=Canna indica TaxID=4628 RepID=A0AAQ3KZ01_9LILI|nr:hypothetical protein Cni_G24419 [Canna indica]
MAQSKEDIKHGAAQAKLSEDEMLRVGYVHGTPLEAGKIADSKPVDLFAGSNRIASAHRDDDDDPNNNSTSGRRLHGDDAQSRHQPQN